jgi:hypothetical protein
MAGAMSAIGGDFSTAASNPAGLAKFRKSNINGTLNIELLSADTDFYGSSTVKKGTEGNISNFSYLKAYNLDPKKYSNWYGVQLGIGVTRIKSFNERIEYKGNSESSILHSFVDEANGTPDSLLYDQQAFKAGLAYDVFAIDPIGDNNYISGFTAGKAIHNRVITRRGGMNEYNFTLSGNYANKIYLGGSFNLTRVKFEEDFTHREAYTDTSLWLQEIQYTGNLDIDGWGYGLRLGLIALPTDWLQLGLAAQLPTLYNLSDRWTNDMTAKTDAGDKFVDPSFIPVGNYDYRIVTPFKANGSVGIILPEFGTIGVEVEFVDYGNAKLSDLRYTKSPYSFNAENAQIQNIYRSVLNYKIGAEARLTSQAYLRGGFALYNSPFAEGKGNVQYPTVFYTGGAGYNWGKFYTDIAIVSKQFKTDYYAYNPLIEGSKSTSINSNFQMMFSFGVRLD